MKFWKNLAVCTTLALSCVAFNGCNYSRNRAEVSKDLDGDGAISQWETIFDTLDSSDRIITVNNIQNISSLSDLKAINEKTDEVNYYMLTKNIDCGGEEICINLGKSVLFGNNKVIKNFKLKELGFGMGEEETHIDANIYGLFYNGVAIYDLRLFMGYQKISIDDLREYNCVSPLINVSTIDNVTVKGKLDVSRLKTEGLRGDNKFDVSLVASNLNGIDGMIDIATFSTNISNVQAIGGINYSEDEITNTTVRIGGIMPDVASDGMVYNAKSSVDISASSSGALIVGGVVAENCDFVSTCEYLGKISTTYAPNSSNYVGGIVGRNFEDSEIKNCVYSGHISFETSVVSSIKPDMNVGGIVGRNLGVVNFVESNGDINITNAYLIKIGGICGSSEFGIFSNIINRTNIVLKNCQDVYIAEVTGISKLGSYKHVVDMSTISIDNGEIVSSVRLGMFTIFEEKMGSSSDTLYDAEYSPTFYGILMTGSSNVRQKKVNDTTDTNFVYNLGLRNVYEYEVIDSETGLPKTEVKKDNNGNPEKDDEGNEITYVVTKTRVPDQYSKIFYLSNYSKSLKKYSILENNPAPIDDDINMTFAKNEDKSNIITGVSSTRLRVNFFVRDLGFMYGANHNQTNLEIDGDLVDLDKLYFTLSTDESLTKYFEKQNANGDLSYYDNYFEDALNFDEDLDKNSEIYSYFNNLLLSNTTKTYVPLKFSYAFASAQDENNTDVSITLENNFAKNLSYVIGMIVGVDPSIVELNSNKENVLESISESAVRYEKLEVSDSTYRYAFTFNICQMESDSMAENIHNNYVVYMQYEKGGKY